MVMLCPSPPTTSTGTALQWLSLVVVIWLQSINGTNSNFPTYSSQLKDILSMSQIQLNNFTFASDAGKLLGWISGLATLYLPLWLVLMVGSTIGLIGYGVQYLIITNNHVFSHSYWTILLLNIIAGNSICWINTVCYILTLRNFGSAYSQVAVGLSTSYQGLSAKIYNGIVDAGFPFLPSKGMADSYLLLNSALPLLVSVVAAPIIGRSNSVCFENSVVGKRESVGFIILFMVTIATGAYAVVSSLGLVANKLSPLGNVICMGIFLAAPLSVPMGKKIRQKWCENREMNNRVYDDDMGAADDQVVSNSNSNSNSGVNRIEEGRGVVKDPTNRSVRFEEEEEQQVGDEKMRTTKMLVMEEVGVKLMVKRVDFWLYFFVYAFGATLGLVYLNNLGQIAESRGYSRISSLVSLSSSFGFFGRLIPSLADYFLSHLVVNYIQNERKVGQRFMAHSITIQLMHSVTINRSMKMVTRPMSIVGLMAPMPVAFFILVTSTTTLALYVSTAIIGVCTGAITSVSVSLTTELFGTKNFSVNHNVVIANIPIGSFVFGYIAAYVYHNNKAAASSGKCLGVDCYGTTFIVWGGLSLVGTLLAVILYVRTKKLYVQQRLVITT